MSNIRNQENKLIATAKRVHPVNAANETQHDVKVWHSKPNNRTAEQLVTGFNYEAPKQDLFCEPCAQGKLHKSSFPKDGAKRAKEPLDLVHSDVCGKMNTKSVQNTF